MMGSGTTAYGQWQSLLYKPWPPQNFHFVILLHGYCILGQTFGFHADALTCKPHTLLLVRLPALALL